jgi:hypothetical protein
VAAFYGAVLHGIDDRQTRHDFTRCERLDLEFAVCHFADGLAHHLGGAIERVQ